MQGLNPRARDSRNGQPCNHPRLHAPAKAMISGDLEPHRIYLSGNKIGPERETLPRWNRVRRDRVHLSASVETAVAHGRAQHTTIWYCSFYVQLGQTRSTHG